MKCHTCKKCKEFWFEYDDGGPEKGHVCPPLWDIVFCWSELGENHCDACDEGCSPKTYYGRTLTEAVSKWAREEDFQAGDPPRFATMIEEESETGLVRVRKSNSSEPWKFYLVTGELVPKYRVEEVGA